MKRTKHAGFRVAPDVMASIQRLQTRAKTNPQNKTIRFMDEMHSILEAYHPMTVRQLFYRLVATQVIENTVKAYDKVSRDCGNARLQGRIPWEWIEDRVRIPTLWSMWDSPEDFLSDIVDQYWRQIWGTQRAYVEVVIEKDALSGVFVNVLEEYRVGLNVNRGFSGLSASKEMASRLYRRSHKFKIPVYLFYFGDFDPEGFEIQTALESVIRHHEPNLVFKMDRVALNSDQVTSTICRLLPASN